LLDEIKQHEYISEQGKITSSFKEREKHTDVACRAGDAGEACAVVPIDEISAGSTSPTWVGCTIVDVGEARRARIPRRAGAGKLVHAIKTRASVLARVGRTVVDVVVAARTIEALSTLALVLSELVDTRGAIQTGRGLALVNVDGARGAGVASVTDTLGAGAVTGTKAVDARRDSVTSRVVDGVDVQSAVVKGLTLGTHETRNADTSAVGIANAAV
jgi:hypothetical protein